MVNNMVGGMSGGVCDSSADNRGMVNNMVGGMSGGVSLDRNLGDMMDPMVDLYTNLVNNRGSSNSNWGNMSISSMGNSRGSIGSVANSWGSIGMMGNSWGSNSMSSRVNTSYQTMSISKNLSISISFSLSNRGSKAATNQRKNNEEFHAVVVVVVRPVVVVVVNAPDAEAPFVHFTKQSAPPASFRSRFVQNFTLMLVVLAEVTSEGFRPRQYLVFFLPAATSRKSPLQVLPLPRIAIFEQENPISEQLR